MIFYSKPHNAPLSDDYQYPCFILVNNGWDDFSFKATFELQFYENRKTRIVIGTVKIMDINNDEQRGRTILPDSFEELPDNFCSLGFNLSYYEKFERIEEFVNALKVLDALNDAACLPKIKDEFENTRGFQTSLLRERESKSALLLGERVIKKLPINSKIKFSFSTKLKNADLAHEVNFEFDKNENLQRRLFAIVGKNGTGKTQFISNLANALSFSRTEEKLSHKKNNKEKQIREFETGTFDTPLGPPFGKVIALSYSLFDNFKRPKASKRFSYIYCGIRNEDDDIDKNQLTKRHISSIQQINYKGRGEIWAETLRRFVEPEQLGYEFLDCWYNIKEINNEEASKILTLSSGQSMLIYSLTELIANCSENSLVLFDEPENHLHPNAIVNLINSINELMVIFDSFAIISTHSPLVIQEIPSKNVFVFERDGNTPITRPLEIESYGENLTTITKHIFETNEVKDGYKNYLERLSRKKSMEEIIDLFDNGLSLNAKLYLSSLYSTKEEENEEVE